MPRWNVDKLITLVQERPEIWDTRSNLYLDRTRKDAAWEQVARSLRKNEWAKVDSRGRAELVPFHILQKVTFVYGSPKVYTKLGGVPQKDMLQPSNSQMQLNLDDVLESQAVNDDYRNSGYSRGHVNPSGHHSSASQLSTFTYTNMAPQDATFNSGTWNAYETFLRDKILTTCQQTHVLSGVIISGSHPGEGKWLRNRVNVPTFYWSAFCCVKSDGTRRAEGRIGRNQSPYDTVTKTISDLEAILSNEYGGQVSLFAGGCQ
ncbi:uncharacterized protein LOC122930344 [Bufo gargarizans]|uniref:uncharacterized protein LOC122930344 n=1 Tax=Bufo gargarizans TaxID=30331 RepID=UPI001CF20D7E|nr:uncharacterized protein LOC122930344 [Bufo gargarizans]